MRQSAIRTAPLAAGLLLALVPGVGPLLALVWLLFVVADCLIVPLISPTNQTLRDRFAGTLVVHEPTR